MRWNEPPTDAAKACASRVLPTPGMSSIRRCPPLSRQPIAIAIESSRPASTAATDVAIRSAVSATAATGRSWCAIVRPAIVSMLSDHRVIRSAA